MFSNITISYETFVDFALAAYELRGNLTASQFVAKAGDWLLASDRLVDLGLPPLGLQTGALGSWHCGNGGTVLVSVVGSIKQPPLRITAYDFSPSRGVSSVISLNSGSGRTNLGIHGHTVPLLQILRALCGQTVRKPRHVGSTLVRVNVSVACAPHNVVELVEIRLGLESALVNEEITQQTHLNEGVGGLEEKGEWSA